MLLLTLTIVGCGGGGGGSTNSEKPVTSAPSISPPTIIVQDSFNIIAFQQVEVAAEIEYDSGVDLNQASISISYDDAQLEVLENDIGNLLVKSIVNLEQVLILTITTDDKSGNIVSKDVIFNVSKNMPPIIVMDQSLSVYPGFSYNINLSVQDDDPTVLYEWDLNDNLSITNIENWDFNITSSATSDTIDLDTRLATIIVTDSANNISESSIELAVFNNIEISDYQVQGRANSQSTDGCAIAIFGLACWGTLNSSLDELVDQGIDKTEVESFATSQSNLAVVVNGKAYSSLANDKFQELPLSVGEIRKVFTIKSQFVLVTDNSYILNPGDSDMEIVEISSPVLNVFDDHILFEDGTFKCLGAFGAPCLPARSEPVSSISVSSKAIFYMVNNELFPYFHTQETIDFTQVNEFIDSLGNIEQVASNAKTDEVYFLIDGQIRRAKFVGQKLEEFESAFGERSGLSKIYTPNSSPSTSEFVCAINQVNRLTCINDDSNLELIPGYFSG